MNCSIKGRLFRNVSRYVAILVVLTTLLIAVDESKAAILERFCTCQAYGGTNGYQIPGQRTYLEDAHLFAVHFCETGARHAEAREGSGVFCNPASCPSGTVDLGVTVRDCHGIKKSREAGSLPVPDSFAPVEGGCNYVPAETPAAGTITCDLQCQKVRKCLTAIN